MRPGVGVDAGVAVGVGAGVRTVVGGRVGVGVGGGVGVIVGRGTGVKVDVIPGVGVKAASVGMPPRPTSCTHAAVTKSKVIRPKPRCAGNRVTKLSPGR